MAATASGGYMTLVDQAKLKDPNGGIAEVVELLKQSNACLDDIYWAEGNLDAGHQSTVRTSLPTVGYRYVGEASPTGKSTTAQINDQTGILTAWSEVPKETAERGGHLAETRMSEAEPFLEAMNQKFVGKLKYGNGSLVPKEFTGFFPRYASTAGVTGQNVILCGGAGSDNTSILLVGWSKKTVFCVFPKGTKAGIEHEDFGLQVLQDVAATGPQLGGSRLAVYQERWEWKHGLVVKDWRYAARGANIDVSNLVTKSSAADLPDTIIKLWHRIPNHEIVREGLYMSRTCFEMLDIQLRDDVIAGGQLKYEDVFGRKVPTFRGIPIRVDDQQLETEATIT